MQFEPLKKEDLPQLDSWLRLPHVREFYHKRPIPSWEEVRAEYLQRIHPNWPTRCFLSYVAGKPIGYVQTYRLADYPEYGRMIGEERGISLDLFIGDVEYMGKGWGPLILVKFLNEVAFPMFRTEETCWIYHDELNQRALHASQAAGFRFVRGFMEEGEPKELFAISRDESATRADELLG